MFRIFSQIFFVTLLFSMGCKAPEATTVKESNMAKSINPSGLKIHPSFGVYHDLDSSSLLYIKIFPKELLYSMANSEGIYKGTLKIYFELFNVSDLKEKTLADSGTYVYNFKREGVEQRFIASVPIAAKQGNIYQLKISATDMIRKEELLRYIQVDKRNVFSQQNYLILDSSGRIPYFAPYVLSDNNFRIESRNTSKFKSVYVLYYGSEMPLPKPSFTTIRENSFLSDPDSVWILPFKENLVYQLNYEGMYFFQVDTAIDDGLTILNLGEDFPYIKTSEELVDPLAYLATPVEYDEMKNAKNLKITVDNFWLHLTDNIERSRELIRIYYNRVYLANYYFTSFKPGWKTDRGMIYIIYGPPQTLYRADNDEKWIYYRKNFSSSVTFTFSSSNSPYTQENFVLIPSDSYDISWREAITSWRKGEVFLFN